MTKEPVNITRDVKYKIVFQFVSFFKLQTSTVTAVCTTATLLWTLNTKEDTQKQ